MTKPPKDFSYWKTTVLRDWPSRLVLTVLVGFAGFVWAQGKEVVRDKIMETVKPSLDTLAKKQEGTDQKVDSVNRKVDKVDAKVDALIALMVDAFPQVKKAAADQALRDSTNQAIKNALAGDRR